MTNAKPWYKSKTIWTNTALVIIAAVLATPELTDFVVILPETWREMLLKLLPLLAAVVNIYLRTVSGQPIGQPAAQVEATRDD